jgi:predicted small lipoprotein YifL
MQIFPLRFFFLVCALFMLAGCGKKGNLYLPDVPGSVPTAPQSTLPAQK